MKRILIGAGVAAVVAVVLWLSIGESEGNGPSVDVEKVGRRTVVASVKASGEINPLRKVEIQSKVIGEITAIPVKEGERVKEGQVILQIEKKLYVAARDQARAALDQATVTLQRTEAEVADAKIRLGRAQRLFDQGVVSQESLDQARLAEQTAAIAVKAQQETIHQFQSAYQKAVEDVDRTTIRAPMDGTVTALNVEVGETAIMGTMNYPGSVLMVIGDLSEIVAEVEVAESEVVSLALGQPATVTLDALPDVKIPGKVLEISSSGTKDGDVVKFKVKVRLESRDPRIKPGMTAKVEITTATAKDALAVPQQAVQSRWVDEKGKAVTRREGDASQKEISVVYLYRDGKAVQRTVTTGVHDELWVEVSKGLEEGDEVITGPYRTLRAMKDGEDVRRAKPAEAAGDGRTGG